MRPLVELGPVDFVVIWQPASADPSLPWWWRRLVVPLLEPGFAHVLVIQADYDGGSWVVLDPLFGGLRLRSLPLTVTCAQLLGEYPGTTWACLSSDRRTYPQRVRWGLTCVAAVAAVLALHRTPLTPFALYRHIAELTGSERPRR